MPDELEDLESRIGELRFGGALMTVMIFKILAGLSVFAGSLLLVEAIRTDEAEVYAEAVVVGTALSAALFWFCGYVLEILVSIFEQVWHLRWATQDDDGTDDG